MQLNLFKNTNKNKFNEKANNKANVNISKRNTNRIKSNSCNNKYKEILIENIENINKVNHLIINGYNSKLNVYSSNSNKNRKKSLSYISNSKIL